MCVLVCVLISLHLTAAGLYKAKLDGALSQAICASTAEYSASEQVQAPLDDASKMSPSSNPSCQVVKWTTNCGNNIFNQPRLRTNLRKGNATHLNVLHNAAAFPSGPKSTRIVGGTDALPNEFPHQVYFKRPQRPPVFCGGSVLSAKYVLSAAHCFYGIDTTGYSFVAGGHNVKVLSGREQERELKKITLHQSYDPGPKYSDIAILEVDPSFNLTDFVKPVLLPESNYVATGDFVVTGWGTLKSGGSQPDILQKVTVPIVTDQECGVGYKGGITSTMICAGYLGVGGKDACQGDSGGPLARKMKNGSYLIVGVVSWGINCADPNYMGVYTEVAKFLDWIHNNTDTGTDTDSSEADC